MSKNNPLNIHDLKTLKIIVIQKMKDLKTAYEDIRGEPIQFGSPEQDYLDHLLEIVNKLEDLEGFLFRLENVRKLLEEKE